MAQPFTGASLAWLKMRSKDDRTLYEDRCARIPSRPEAQGLHKQAGYIDAKRVADRKE